MADKFNSLDDTQKQNIVKFALMAAAAGPLILGFGKNDRILGLKILGRVLQKYVEYSRECRQQVVQ